MVPLMQALVVAGHDVRVATAPDFCPLVRRIGFDVFAAGLGPRGRGEMLRRFPEVRAARADDPAPWRQILDRTFAVALPAMLGDLDVIIAAWRPDLLVHESAEFASAIAGTKEGVPYVNHGFGMVRATERAAEVTAKSAALWQESSLEPQPVGGNYRYLYLDVWPPSMQRPEIDDIPVAHPIRSVGFDDPGGSPPPTWIGSLGRPIVCVTMGTIWNRDFPVLGDVLSGLARRGLSVVATVGEDIDPASVGPQPDAVRVHRYLPLSHVLPHCDLMICHGGAGTVLSGLRHGVPMVLLPQGADHFDNARACVDAGVAHSFAFDEASPHQVLDRACEILDNHRCRTSAESVRDEIAATPPPASFVPLLERLAVEEEPIIRRTP